MATALQLRDAEYTIDQLEAEVSRLKSAVLSMVYKQDGKWLVGVHGDMEAPPQVNRALAAYGSTGVE